jgi:cyclophilin family peptidyl-prolyl cis-trans isomerase
MSNRLPVRALGLVLISVGPALTGICAAAQQTPATTATDAPAADPVYDDLRQDFKNLHESLQNKGGIAPEDHAVINAFAARAEAFSASHPTDGRPIAMLLQIAYWLKEDSRVDALTAKLVETRPDDVKVRLTWAKYHKGQNHYARALEILNGYSFDLAKTPEAAVLKSDCLFAENRFQEAVDALNAIPAPEALKVDEAAGMLLKNQLENTKPAREQYLQFWAEEEGLRESEAQADDLPRVEIVTARGPIVVELFENHAPNTVANFISLAEKDFYTGTKFHRVMPNFMAQGGDPNSKSDAALGAIPGQGGPGYFIADEVGETNPRKHFAGTLSMANSGPNTNGSQFFITFEPTPHLNGRHTVFGRVLEGLEVARSIQKDDVIEAVHVLRKRDHEYVPQPLSEATPPTPPQPTTAPATTAPTGALTIPGNVAKPE